MSHKRVEKRTLERVEEDISHAKSSIARIRELSDPSRSGREALLAFLKDLSEVSAAQRDDFLLKLGLGQISPDAQHAITWAAAQERAYKNIIEILESPETVSKYYQADLVGLENERNAYKDLEQPR